MMSRSKHSARIVAALVVLAVLLVGGVVVRATKDGKTSDSLTYAGTLTGVGEGMQNFSFVLHNGGTNCAVSKMANVAASGAFAVTFSASDSACLAGFFDGGDVTVDISVAGVTITGQPITPVPYAKYADTAVNYAPNLPIAQIVPVGTVIAYAGAVGGTAPPGWLLCDGTSVLRSTYPALFAAIGTSAGAADGTHFNLPDYRGLFLRGVAQGSDNDPDRAGRTALKSGGNTGDQVGSFQADQVVSHTHAVGTTSIFTNGGATPGPGVTTGSSVNTSSTGGSETRPKNASVNYLIKY